MTDADRELAAALARARKGDEDAFRVVYRTVQPALLRYLRVLVADEAEDVASDAWLQISRDLGSFKGDADSFRGWCASIARNRALDHVRRRKCRPVAADAPVEEYLDLPAAENTEAIAVERVDGNAALALIATLPPDQAEAVTLRVIVGLDAEAAAKVLGKRAGAVRTAAHRGLRNLAKQITTDNPSSHGVTNDRVPALKDPR